jgi:hypothetical protein
MTDPDNLVDFEVPAHYGPTIELPCFACWLESVLHAAGNVYDDEGQKAYEAALGEALKQMATGMGALLANLLPDRPQLMRDQFVAHLDTAVLFHGSGVGLAAHH